MMYLFHKFYLRKILFALESKIFAAVELTSQDKKWNKLVQVMPLGETRSVEGLL